MKKLFVLALLGLAFCGACTQTQPRPISAIYAVYAVDSLGNNVFPFDSILYPKGYPFTTPFNPYESYWIDSRGNKYGLYRATHPTGIKFGMALADVELEHDLQVNNGQLIWIMCWADSLKKDTLRVIEPHGIETKAKYIILNNDTISNADGYMEPNRQAIFIVK